METKKKFPWWVILLVVVVLCICCVVIVAAGFMFVPSMAEKVQSPVVDIVQTFVPQPTLQYEHPILPDATESFDPGTGTDPYGLTGSQVYEGTYLYDDFSSDALGWPVANDELSILQYEDGQYSYQVLQKEEFDWAYPPIDFLPTDIWFDVKGLPGPQNGTVGVFCQDQDIDNYYFVEFDLETRSYLVGVVRDAEFSYLTPENTEGNHWVDSNAINSKPEQVNHIGISCTLDYITLFINDEWQGEFIVTDPFAARGDMALFVYAFDFADENGYKVFFDNVEIYTFEQ